MKHYWRCFRRCSCRAVFVGTLLAGLISSIWAISRTNHLEAKKRPPHYTGKAPQASKTWAHVMRLGSSFHEPSPNQEVQAVLDRLLPQCEQFLQELGISKQLGIPSEANLGDLPEIYVGHPEGFWAPDDVFSDEDRERYGRHVALISVSDPPLRWTKQIAERVAELSAAYVVYVTLELSDYAVAQTNWKGSKAIELGTGFTLAVPWLTSLDQLAEVLQFKGVLYRADGRFVRAGAEAFHAQRTPFRQAILNTQRSMRAPELEAAFLSARPDLPGQQLAWQVALQNLVAQLSGRTDLLIVPNN